MNDKPLDELSDEQLDGIAGGYIFDASVLCEYPADVAATWEVLDAKGNVVESCVTRSSAEYHARKRGESTTLLTWDQVQKLRKTGSPY